MESISFYVTDGSVNVAVTVSETVDGSLRFDLEVLDDSGIIGDLNGLFFDLTDDSIADSLVVSGGDVTGIAIKADGVTKVDSYNNVQGEVVKEDGKFDLGVQFGTSGIGEDDIRSTSFTLSTDDGSALSISDIVNQDFAVRLTSVGTEDGAREDSVKISGTSEPIIEEPQNIAADDTMTVSSNDIFDFFGNTVNGFDQSVLGNDTSGDGTPYAGVVTGANGAELGPDPLVGSNGGLLIIDEFGHVDFSANGEFDHLAADQTDVTTFTYEIEGGDTALIAVTVFGFDGSDGGGGGIGVF